MSDMLQGGKDLMMGSVQSGTPIETRAGAGQYASWFQDLLKGGDWSSEGMGRFQRLGAQSFANLFGITPGEAGTGDVIASMLMNPEDRTRGLFASMRPFEQRQTAEAVAGTRGMFGTAGGRFSRNLADAESRVRGELSNQFARTRQEGLLAANAQRGQFLSQLFGLANENARTSLMPLQIGADFLRPSPPVHQGGLLGPLLNAGATAFAAWQMMQDRPSPGMIPQEPTGVPVPSDPFGPGGPYWNPSY